MSEIATWDYDDRYGPGQHCAPTLAKIFDQWVHISRESEGWREAEEIQMARLFECANTRVYVHQSAP